MIAWPHCVVLHQQLGSQLQTQLNGLWIFSRRLRPIGRILVCGYAANGTAHVRSSLYKYPNRVVV